MNHTYRISALILRVGFAVILAELLLMTANLFLSENTNPIYAFRFYRKSLEYIMLDISIVIGGSFLFDLAVSDKGNS